MVWKRFEEPSHVKDFELPIVYVYRGALSQYRYLKSTLLVTIHTQ